MAFIEKALVLCLFLCAEILVSAQLEVGDTCGPNKDRRCLLAINCPEALAAIRDRKGHGLTRCGWQGTDEIVCCTKPKILDRGPLRKSTEACMQYWKVSEVDYTSFIIKGYNATLGDFPHMAALGYEKDSDGTISWGDCGGTLISKNFVLTAAHCIIRSDGRKPVMVRLGKVDILGNEDNAEPQDIKVIEDIPFKDYKHFEKLNDIALLRLEKDVEINNNVKPACMYVEKNIPNNAGLIIAGWGKTNRTGTTSRFLLKGYVKAVDTKKCNETYISTSKKSLQDTHLCAFSPEDYPSDTCQGDSGGPLQIENRKDNKESPLIIVGVTSFGKGCGGPIPSVYTRVSSFLDWIEGIVWP